MLKLPLKYTNFNDEEVEGIFYFNLSKVELVKLEVENEAGFERMIEKISETNDRQKLIDLFQRIILSSYGEKSEDGNRFIKSDAHRADFEQTAAYHELFMRLASDQVFATTFINGIMPKDLVAAAADQDKPTGRPTPPPAAPTI